MTFTAQSPLLGEPRGKADLSTERGGAPDTVGVPVSSGHCTPCVCEPYFSLRFSCSVSHGNLRFTPSEHCVNYIGAVILLFHLHFLTFSLWKCCWFSFQYILESIYSTSNFILHVHWNSQGKPGAFLSWTADLPIPPPPSPPAPAPSSCSFAIPTCPPPSFFPSQHFK